MASIHDLVAKIADPDLRAKIEAEVNRLSKQKKFGLVFEDHMPECTPLYDDLNGGSFVQYFASIGIFSLNPSSFCPTEKSIHFIC